jgi:hypothetical protein
MLIHAKQFIMQIIAMKNFDSKKYFGNLVGMPTAMKLSTSKPML